ncbi:MAG: hypothetical protein JKY08_04190 [Flavobacteriaceae bacterium]|nr:hypothetical protein [Flavobacteriaceae bacterium]
MPKLGTRKLYHIVKQEFDIAKYNTNIEIKSKLVKDAIETYNRKRPHLSNYMLTPIQIHRKKKLKRKQYKSKKLNDGTIV